MTKTEFSPRNPLQRYLLEPQLMEQGQRFYQAMLRINDAHALMLYDQGIISQHEAKQLLGLSRELSEKGVESLSLVPEKEDLYLNMEAHIIQELGDLVGGKLHTGRSRNDLYAAIQRLKCREELLRIADLLVELRRTLLDVAAENLETVIPGYTHMQPAQPITYGHYLAALSSALKRDFDRLIGTYGRTNLNPMGAGALAGTGFPINRTETGKFLGFDGDLLNTLDAVASRDYVAEIVSAVTILLSNIGRINQDFYVWVTSEFSTIKLPDEFVAGSSIMPQKRNPIVFEHMMAKVSHVLAAFVSVITTMKGLPYTHTRGTGAEVFTLLWKGFEETELALRLMISIIEKIEINSDNALLRARRNFSTVTEVADEIVRNMGVSFRTAHEIVRRAVLKVYKEGKTSEDLTIHELDESCKTVLGKPLVNVKPEVIAGALDPLENVKRRKVPGGPAPAEVDRTIGIMRGELAEDIATLQQIKDRIQESEREMERRISEINGTKP